MSVRPIACARFLCALVLFLSLGARAANLGLIDGSVRDFEGQPLAGVRIVLSHEGRRVDAHVADAAGHFEFEQIHFGAYTVEAVAPDGRRDLRLVQVTSGEVTLVELFLPIAGQEVVIEVPKPKAPTPARTSSTLTTLERSDLRSLPRGDTATVNEVLATQPGFVGDAFGNLFARGNHANIQYQLDGVALPDSLGGLFGGFLSPKSIESLEVITGGLPAEYGERLASVVNLNSRHYSAEGEGELELQGGSFQTVMPSLSYGRGLGPVSLSGGLVLKRTDRALDPPSRDSLLNAQGNEQRGFLRVEHEPSEHTHLSALALFSRNHYGLPVDPTLKAFDPSRSDGGRDRRCANRRRRCACARPSWSGCERPP